MKTAYAVIKESSPWVIHDVICELGEYLSDKHHYSFQTQVGGHLYIADFNYHIPDCEILIYNKETDCLKAVSFSERRTPLFTIFQTRNNPNDILVVLHHRSWGIYGEEQFEFKLKRTTTYTLHNIHLKNGFDYFFNERLSIKHDKLIDKMFLRTTTGRGDEVELSKRNIINPLFSRIGYVEYMKLAIQYKIGLSIGAGYEMCHRDIEYMAIGLPMLRLEYTDKYSPELIPNYHYISIDRKNEFEFDSHKDNVGGEKYIQAYVNRFNEVKNDYAFLDFISSNANKYYKSNCSPETRLQTVLKQLEIA